MGRLKKLLNLLVLAVAGIVIWHEFIEPQRQTAGSGSSPQPAKSGGGSNQGEGGTSPWDGAPSARDAARSDSGAGSDTSSQAADGLAAAVAAVNTLTERVAAVANDLAARREAASSDSGDSGDSGESGDSGVTGSVEVSDPRQLSSASRFQGGDETARGERSDQSGGENDASAAADDQASRSASTGGENASRTESRQGAISSGGAERSGNSTAESERTEAGTSSSAELAPDIAPSTGAPYLDAAASAASAATGDGGGAGTGPVGAEGGGPQSTADGATATANQSGSGSGTSGEAGGGSGAAQVSVPTGAVQGDGGADCPEGFPVKGNATSRIYHEPGRASYDRTIPEFCFESVDAATAAGFRAPKH